MSTSRYGRLFWRSPAHLIWLALVLAHVIVIFAGLPDWFQALQQPCTASPTECQSTMQLLPERAALWSMPAYAWYQAGSRLLALLVGLFLGVLVFVRRPNSRIAWITSLFLIIGTNTSLGASLALARPIWLPLTLGLQFLGEITLVLFFLLFPNESFAPRWTRWFPWFYGLVSGAGTVLWALLVWGGLQPATAARVEDLRLTSGVLMLLLLLVLVGVIVYRYRAVFDPIEKAQTRWVVFAFAVSYGAFAALIILSLALGFDLEAVPPWQFVLEGLVINGLPDFLIPAAITIAILRHRLFDIDLVIRRALQYTLLTGLLALVYFGSVVLLQSLVENMTGDQSPLVIVISTLAIAALFNPLWLRVQAFIDRRFYRRKYNAERNLARFAETARDEVDIDKLAAALLSVLDETMQPETASLWIKKE